MFIRKNKIDKKVIYWGGGIGLALVVVLAVALGSGSLFKGALPFLPQLPLTLEAPQITSLTANPTQFLYNSKESSTISYTVDQDVTITAAIYGYIGNEQTLVKKMFNDVAVAKGSYNVTWNGTDGSNEPAKIGIYVFKLSASNNLGKDTKEVAMQIVQAAAPDLSSVWAEPTSFYTNNPGTTVTYTLDKAAKLTANVYKYVNNDLVVVKNILSNYDIPSTVTYNFAWDGKDNNGTVVPAGKYKIRLVVVDTLAQQDTADVEVTVLNPPVAPQGTAPVLSNAYITPYTFNPDNEYTGITFTQSSNPGTTNYINVQILDGNTVIKNLASKATYSSLTNTVYWDGKNLNGNKVPAKTYKWKIDATNTYGPSNFVTGDVTVSYSAPAVNNEPSLTHNYTDVKAFNPQKNEHATIYFQFNMDARATIEIWDGGKKLQTLMGNNLVSGGKLQSVEWYGIDEKGNVFPEKNYSYKIYGTNNYGSSNTAMDGIQISFASSTPPPSNSCADFTDVTTGNPNCEAIAYFKEKKIVQGYGDEFRPYNQINRAEASKIMVLTRNMSLVGNRNLGFRDIDTAAWYMPYIATLWNAGVLKGYPDGSFKPDYSITKAEFLKIVVTVIGKSSPSCNSTPFQDVPSNDWFTRFVCYAYDEDLIDYTSEFFNPHVPIIRGEAVEILYRAEQKGLL